jgi:hypothetical protein
METKCPGFSGRLCPLCGLFVPPDECPLSVAAPFDGPPIGAVQANGGCSDAEVCESCQ